jgi:hypothetical protein
MVAFLFPLANANGKSELFGINLYPSFRPEMTGHYTTVAGLFLLVVLARWSVLRT